MTGLRWLMGLFFALFIIAGVAMVYSKNWAKKHPDAIQLAARADLDLIRQSQQSFHSRFGTYTTDLRSLAIRPKFVYYKVGFLQPGDVKVEGVDGHDPKIKDLDILRADVKIRYAEETKLTEIDFASLNTFCADCTATKDAFKAIAVANLDKDADLDVWTVDQTGNFTHVQNDLK